MEFGGQILSYHKFKGAVFGAQKVDKALYLEIDLKVATQKYSGAAWSSVSIYFC